MNIEKQEVNPVDTTPTPDWLTKDGKVDEIEFCKEFLNEYPMLCINGNFFNYDGRIKDENLIKQKIMLELKPHITRGISRNITNLIDILKAETYSEPIPIKDDVIYTANGTLQLDGAFSYEKKFCYNRLPINYDPINAPKPDAWLKFVEELLYPEDIPTLQEFMGYSLIPSNRAQKMLLIIGNGGEGKSRIGIVMQKIMGQNMNNGSISKIETSPFARADLENQLLLIDDDLKLEALPQTNYIKTIVTAELPMDLEKKGMQSYQGILYSRMMAFGNGTLQSLHDKSIGFFRRQIILKTKDKPEDRIDDPYLSDKLCAEAEGIFIWCVEGLQRLVKNNFQFTISERAKENIKEAMKEGNNIIEFLDSEGYIRFDSEECISTAKLYAIYEIWCKENGYIPFKRNSLSTFLKSNKREYNVIDTNKIPYKGRYIRGFKGIEGLIDSIPIYNELGAGT